MNSDLTFIIATNKRNFSFISPFIYFASKYNQECIFDCYIYNDCNINLIEAELNFLKCNMNCKINLVTGINLEIMPQTYRFLIEPIHKTKYSYCCDIDIMICENILDFHVNRLQNGKYCYDNEIRYYIDDSKMSGLHFCTQEWYLKTKNIRNDLLNTKIPNNMGENSCERILKMIAEKSQIRIHPPTISKDQFAKNRPLHGQHISLSRCPFIKTSSINNELDNNYKNEFIKTINDNEFKQLMNICQPQIKNIFNIYLEYVNLKQRF